MNKQEFMCVIKKSLNGISEAERTDILYDYEEHFMIGCKNGKTEEQICIELGDPEEIAKNYIANSGIENNNFELKDKSIKPGILERTRLSPLGLSLILSFFIITVIYFCSSSGIASNSKSKTGINTPGVSVGANGIKIGGLNIDSSGIHGDGISIDNSGIHGKGVNIDKSGISGGGLNIDDSGIHGRGISIDDKGVKIDVPNTKINIATGNHK